MHAVIKQATFPAIIARSTTLAMSDFRCGAITPNPPNIMPIEPKFAKPHNA